MQSFQKFFSIILFALPCLSIGYSQSETSSNTNVIVLLKEAKEILHFKGFLNTQNTVIHCPRYALFEVVQVDSTFSDFTLKSYSNLYNYRIFFWFVHKEVSKILYEKNHLFNDATLNDKLVQICDESKSVYKNLNSIEDTLFVGVYKAIRTMKNIFNYYFVSEELYNSFNDFININESCVPKIEDSKFNIIFSSKIKENYIQINDVRYRLEICSNAKLMKLKKKIEIITLSLHGERIYIDSRKKYAYVLFS